MLCVHSVIPQMLPDTRYVPGIGSGPGPFLQSSTSSADAWNVTGYGLLSLPASRGCCWRPISPDAELCGELDPEHARDGENWLIPAPVPGGLRVEISVLEDGGVRGRLELGKENPRPYPPSRLSQGMWADLDWDTGRPPRRCRREPESGTVITASATGSQRGSRSLPPVSRGPGARTLAAETRLCSSRHHRFPHTVEDLRCLLPSALGF